MFSGTLRHQCEMCKGVIHSADRTYTTMTLCLQDRLGINGCPRAVPAIASQNLNVTIADNGLCPSCQDRVRHVEAQALERSMLQASRGTRANAQFDMAGNASNGGESRFVLLPQTVQSADPDELFGFLAGDDTLGIQQGVSELEGDGEATQQ